MRKLMLNFQCLMLNSKFKIQNSKLTSGFTTIELIFVIILISIIATVGFNFIPNYDLQNDTNYVAMEIKERQKNALNYDSSDFSKKTWSIPESNSTDYNLTCIPLKKSSLNNIEAKINKQKPYSIQSEIDSGIDTLCFDFLGRPYEQEQLLLHKTDINVTKGSAKKTISVFPISGYVKIQ